MVPLSPRYRLLRRPQPLPHALPLAPLQRCCCPRPGCHLAGVLQPQSGHGCLGGCSLHGREPPVSCCPCCPRTPVSVAGGCRPCVLCHHLSAGVGIRGDAWRHSLVVPVHHLPPQLGAAMVLGQGDVPRLPPLLLHHAPRAPRWAGADPICQVARRGPASRTPGPLCHCGSVRPAHCAGSRAHNGGCRHFGSPDGCQLPPSGPPRRALPCAGVDICDVPSARERLHCGMDRTAVCQQQLLLLHHPRVEPCPHPGAARCHPRWCEVPSSKGVLVRHLLGGWGAEAGGDNHGAPLHLRHVAEVHGAGVYVQEELPARGSNSVLCGLPPPCLPAPHGRGPRHVQPVQP
eukprot:Sspe_Gene.67937::Locus_40070_Transcript_1_2_Confidence_0.667_Length_2054::g.67937::m.67937